MKLQKKRKNKRVDALRGMWTLIGMAKKKGLRIKRGYWWTLIGIAKIEG